MTRISKEFCAAVAKLHVHGWSQNEIIEHFNQLHGKNAISMALQRAKEFRLLKPAEMDYGACKSAGISRERIDSVILGAHLAKGLRQRSTALRSIDVVHTGAGREPEDFEGRLEDFAGPASRSLAGIIGATKPSSIGVTWGKTLRCAIDAFTSDGMAPQPDRKIFPVCGFPMSSVADHRTATDNALQLHRAINGPQSPFKYALPLVPALIPIGAEDQFLDLFERYSPGYGEIFGAGPILQRKGGLVDRADMILTSLSADKALGALLDGEVIEWAKIGPDNQLRTKVDGDIGGVLIRSAQGHDALVEEFNSHWTGITRHALEHCAQRASTPTRESAGVCVFAIGENKAKMVLTCMLATHESREGEPPAVGLISRLICDAPLARELMTLATSHGIEFKPYIDE
jgi:hypothetical protein